MSEDDLKAELEEARHTIKRLNRRAQLWERRYRVLRNTVASIDFERRPAHTCANFLLSRLGGERAVERRDHGVCACLLCRSKHRGAYATAPFSENDMYPKGSARSVGLS